MRNSTDYQIHKFQPWDKTKKAATTAKRIKTTVTTREETAAVLRTAAMVEEGTVAMVGIAAMTETVPAVETVATAARAPKVFGKRAIIAAEEEIVTVAASAFKKNNAASFNKREKYI